MLKPTDFFHQNYEKLNFVLTFFLVTSFFAFSFRNNALSIKEKLIL